MKYLIFIVFLSSSLFANQYLLKHLSNIPKSSVSTGVGGIDLIYVINLKQRTEKWADVKSKLSQHNLQAVRFDAVNGWKISKRQVKKLTGGLNSYDKDFNRGRVGCALSHISVWNDALVNNFDVIWIMEDDIKIIDSPQKIPSLLAELSKIDPLWDVFYTDPNTVDREGNYQSIPWINCSHPSVKSKDMDHFFKRKSVSDHFEKIHARWGLYSVIISKRGLIKMFRYHLLNDLWSAVDTMIHHVPGIRQYALKQAIVTHDREIISSDTDCDPGDLN